MKRTGLRFLLGLWFCAIGSPAAPDVIDVSVSADQNSYLLGEPITFFVTAANSSPDPVTLTFPTILQAQYLLDGVYTFPTPAGQAISYATIPGNGAHTWKLEHAWDYYVLDVGTHSVTGTVLRHGTSAAPYVFEVIAPLPVTSDVVIDFEHYVDDTPTHIGGEFTRRKPMWRDAYAAYGVRFHSIDGWVNLYTRDGNAYLTTPRTTYPPGFNIVADFDVPVWGISAKVGSAAGQTVTMIALDQNGQVIDSIASATVPSPSALIGPMEFSSTTPIASVQWWPSAANSSVQIDDLYVTVADPVPEPTTLLMALTALLAFAWRRRRGRGPAR